jgi:hypothetical protein
MVKLFKCHPVQREKLGQKAARNAIRRPTRHSCLGRFFQLEQKHSVSRIHFDERRI